jgi:hypothetical protein
MSGCDGKERGRSGRVGLFWVKAVRKKRTTALHGGLLGKFRLIFSKGSFDKTCVVVGCSE